MNNLTDEYDINLTINTTTFSFDYYPFNKEIKWFKVKKHNDGTRYYFHLGLKIWINYQMENTL